MLGAITILLVFQLAGEIVRLLTGAPVPGPVIGMALLFAALVLRRRLTDGRGLAEIPETLVNTADGLLRHLSLLFVPAGVGVMLYLPLIAAEWLAISVALVASTLITIAVTALAMTWLARLTGRSPGEANGRGPE